MKIYTKVVLKIATGEILEEQSFEYQGPVARCGGGGGGGSSFSWTNVVDPMGFWWQTELPDAPEPSDEETALMRSQVNLMSLYSEQLGVQAENQAAIWPYILQNMGLRENAAGEIEQVPWEEQYAAMSPQEQQSYDILGLQQERLESALKGELPVSPALETSLAEQRTTTEEGLSRQLGPNWELSTPGIQRISKFEQGAEGLREAVRYGEISGGGANVIAMQGGVANLQTQGYNQAKGLYNPYELFQGYSGLSSAYGQAQDPWRYYNMLPYQRNLQQSALTSQHQAGLMGAVGGIGAMFAGGGG